MYFLNINLFLEQLLLRGGAILRIVPYDSLSRLGLQRSSVPMLDEIVSLGRHTSWRTYTNEVNKARAKQNRNTEITGAF